MHAILGESRVIGVTSQRSPTGEPTGRIAHV